MLFLIRNIYIYILYIHIYNIFFIMSHTIEYLRRSITLFDEFHGYLIFFERIDR